VGAPAGASRKSSRDPAKIVRGHHTLLLARQHHQRGNHSRARRRHPTWLTQPRAGRYHAARACRVAYIADLHVVSLVCAWSRRSRWVASLRPRARSKGRQSAEGPDVAALELISLQLRSGGEYLSGNVAGTALPARPAGTRRRPGQVHRGARAAVSPPCARHHQLTPHAGTGPGQARTTCYSSCRCQGSDRLEEVRLPPHTVDSERGRRGHRGRSRSTGWRAPQRGHRCRREA
jgi:hypothetical protein